MLRQQKHLCGGIPTATAQSPKGTSVPKISFSSAISGQIWGLARQWPNSELLIFKIIEDSFYKTSLLSLLIPGLTSPYLGAAIFYSPSGMQPQYGKRKRHTSKAA